MNDERDPLRAAVEDYRRAPRDVVPRTHDAVHTARLLSDMAGQTVEVTHYELDERGVSRHVEHVTITDPILPTLEGN